VHSSQILTTISSKGGHSGSCGTNPRREGSAASNLAQGDKAGHDDLSKGEIDKGKLVMHVQHCIVYLVEHHHDQNEGQGDTSKDENEDGHT
jgi:hypothetical protein